MIIMMVVMMMVMMIMMTIVNWTVDGISYLMLMVEPITMVVSQLPSPSAVKIPWPLVLCLCQ